MEPTQEILHGDSREMAKYLPNGIRAVITDPPYGVNYRSRHATTPEGLKYVADVAHDGDIDTAVELFQEVMDLVLPKTTDEAELYVFTRWDIVDTWMQAVRDLDRHGFAYKMLGVWDKGGPGTGDIDANWGCGHELILYCKKGRRDIKSRRSFILSVDQVHATRIVHPTEKPVELIEMLIEQSTDPGDLVVDPFSGSGSTIVAAERMGRSGIGIEMDERYVDVSRHRLGAPSLF